MLLVVLGLRLKNFGSLSYGPRLANLSSWEWNTSFESYRTSVSHLKFDANSGWYFSWKFICIVRPAREL